MYKMPEFTEQDNEVITDFLKDHNFATLIGNDGNRSVATQVPVLIDEEGGKLYLRAHIMRKTDHHLAFEKNPEVLVLFSGPHCYVSASWYSERHIGSTWNYMTVHVRGTIEWLDEEGTHQIIKDLTHKYEDEQEQPELVEAMPDTYVKPMVKAIAGFRIEVRDMQAVFKLSQNRDDESYRNIVTQLWLSDNFSAHEVAEEMMNRRPHLFETSD